MQKQHKLIVTLHVLQLPEDVPVLGRALPVGRVEVAELQAALGQALVHLT